MNSPQPKYRIYPSLLDAYTDYLKSDDIYERYWGFSENPPFSPDEFREKQFHALIDRINRVPFDSEAADKGTAFNEAVDCIVEHRESGIMQIKSVKEKFIEKLCNNLIGYDSCKKDHCEMCPFYAEEERERVVSIDVVYNNRKFSFSPRLCHEFAYYYEGALTQQRVEAILPTCFGDVLVYGVIDELMPLSVHDIKTTGSYYVGKFKGHYQHLVYPYCLIESGNDIRIFEYNITDFKNTYTETYVFNPERDIPVLRECVEDFIRFLNDNRNLITDTKIFGGKENA